MNRVVRYVIAAGLAFIPLLAAAQERSLAPGSTIRFRTGAEVSPHKAHIERLTRDSLLLRTCASCSKLGFSRSEVNHIELFRRAASGWRVVSGFGFGGLIGLVGGAVVATSCHGGDKCDGAILAVPAGGLLGGLIGGLAAYLTSYRWEPLGAL